jgi:hypothetical protein
MATDTTQRTSSIKITDRSIINELRAYESRPADALAEYIWNSFDAGANSVRINYAFPTTTSGVDFGYPDLTIEDDGEGWDMQDLSSIENFLDSNKKKYKKLYKSLPHGSKGVGRFTFYGFAKSVTWKTNFGGTNHELTLERESISNYNLAPKTVGQEREKGTEAVFEVNSEHLNEGFFEVGLPRRLLEKFAWFLTLYPDKSISINGDRLQLEQIVADQKVENIEEGQDAVSVRLVRWERSLADKENSKLYFIDSKGSEVFKCPTGLNHKSDTFFHSAYVRSKLFDDYSPSKEDMLDSSSGQTSILGDKQSKLVNGVRLHIRQSLEAFRKPHIKARSLEIIDEWAKDKILPDVEKYGIAPEQYREVVQSTFIIAPDLYLGVPNEQRKVILNLIASLLGTSDRNLIVMILDQVYKLNDEQKEALEELLSRTTLENILGTLKEIDLRLQVIEDLDRLVNDGDIFKSVKEVEHLQAIINNEFWVFGEEFRLVINTEGSIRKAIRKWAKDILEIEDFDPETHSRKELDLLISKKVESEARIVNIVVELKRPSVKLGEKELSQIRNYRKKILAEPACSGKNIEWIFILIGREYDEDIKRAIENAQGQGEKYKGLIEHIPSENTKMYVRKWSEVINVDLRSRHRYLQEKLNLQLKDREIHTPTEITEDLLEKRSNT